MRVKKRIPIILDFFKNNISVLNEFTNQPEKEKYIIDNWALITQNWFDNSDQRFGQLLINMSLLDYNNPCWYIEEDNWLIKKGYLKLEDIKFWVSIYDAKGNLLDKPEANLLKKLDLNHIKNIINHFGGRGKFKEKSPTYYNYFSKRIKEKI